MKAEKFDQIVEARANERVQKKIAHFQQAVISAARGLTDCRGIPQYGQMLARNKEVVALMVSGNFHKGWPKLLWENEREVVHKELLATMDEFQKALLAAEKAEPGENRPQEAQDAQSAENA